MSVSVRLETRQRVSPSPSCDITQSEHRVAEKYIVLLQSCEVSTLNLVNMWRREASRFASHPNQEPTSIFPFFCLGMQTECIFGFYLDLIVRFPSIVLFKFCGQLCTLTCFRVSNGFGETMRFIWELPTQPAQNLGFPCFLKTFQKQEMMFCCILRLENIIMD